MLCLLNIYCFFPLFSLVDRETGVNLLIDYFTVKGLSLPAELPGKQNPPSSLLYRPFLLSHACIRCCYYCSLYLFWCIAWFCNLQLLPTYLYYMLSIGWLVIHQWPRTLVRVAMLCFWMFWSIRSMCRDQHITAPPLTCTTLQSYYRVPKVIHLTSLLMLPL